MSNDWVDDINSMHEKFGVHDWVRKIKRSWKMAEFMKFRMNFIREEFNETIAAAKNADAEELLMD